MNLNVPDGGVVTGTITPPGDALNPAEILLDFLRRVDPTELERLALQENQAFGGPSTGEAMLAVLRRMAGER